MASTTTQGVSATMENGVGFLKMLSFSSFTNICKENLTFRRLFFTGKAHGIRLPGGVAMGNY